MTATGDWLLAAGLTTALLTAAPRTTTAQLPRTYTLRIDNDAFDFWMAPYNRPDEEYSSGVHLTVDGGDAPWWARFRLNAPPCTTRTRECRAATTELGQDIYGPATSVDEPHPALGSRPNAGWLYLSQTARLLRPDRADALTLTVGVTGPPSLGRVTQRMFHDLAPAFNRPTDWDRQIPFEPGAIARYEHGHRFVVDEDADVGVDLIPHAAASLGNVRTDAEAGAKARIGWHLAHPWLPPDGRASVALSVGATGRAIARDLFLDGRAPLDSTKITHRPLVGSAEVGLEFRYRWLTLGYRAVNDTRSYARGPRWHPWASMVGSVTVDR